MTTKRRFRLPAELGGGEIDGNDEGSRVTVQIRMGAEPSMLELPKWLLTEVKPAVPDEPPPGAYHLDGPGGMGILAVRILDRDGGSDEWCVPAHGWWTSWPFLWQAHGGPDVRIVPLAPKPEPAELPWGMWQGHRNWDISARRHGMVRLAFEESGRLDASHFAADTARDMARALWTAADQAEASTT